ncbi:MAG TPA: hypothetical protein VH539_20730 [Gemmatimonadaceae bacterium]
MSRALRYVALFAAASVLRACASAYYPASPCGPWTADSVVAGDTLMKHRVCISERRV